MDLLIAAKEREIEKSVNNHKITLKIYEQKVKQLDYSHENKLSDIEIKPQMPSPLESFELEKQKTLQKTKEQLKFEQMETEIVNSQKITEIRIQHEKQLSALSQRFEEGLRELITRCETRKDTIKREYEIRRRVDVHEVEERKNQHINELIKNHQNNYSSMKEYYNKITAENLNLIKTLQSQVRELKTRSECNKVALLEYKLENDRLHGKKIVTINNFKLLKLSIVSLEESKRESAYLEALQAQLKQRRSDKIAFQNALSRKIEGEKKLTIARENLNNLRKEFNSVEIEYKELTSTFQEIIKRARAQTDSMQEKLENKLRQLRSKPYDNLSSQTSAESESVTDFEGEQENVKVMENFFTDSQLDLNENSTESMDVIV
jgi:hypothetical protein